MSIALIPLFETHLIDLIYEFIPEEPDIWETCYGVEWICGVKHYVLYGGGPSGGLVFFNKKRRKGWYRWHQNWGQYVRYEKITEGQVASKHLDDEDEKLAILPPNWENLKLKDEDYIVILDDDRMIDHDY